MASLNNIGCGSGKKNQTRLFCYPLTLHYLCKRYETKRGKQRRRTPDRLGCACACHNADAPVYRHGAFLYARRATGGACGDGDARPGKFYIALFSRGICIQAADAALACGVVLNAAGLCVGDDGPSAVGIGLYRYVLRLFCVFLEALSCGQGVDCHVGADHVV